MEEWNRFPAQGTEPSRETSTDGSGIGEQEPQTPSPASQPSPYSSYGWNQTPYGVPTPPKQPRKGGAGVAIGIIGAVCAVVIVTLSVLLALAYQDRGDTDNGPATSPSSNITGGNVPKLEITELDENTQGISTREIVSQNLDSTVLLTIYNTSSQNGFPFVKNETNSYVEAGSASGIILTADGYIITNWHCVVNESTNQPFARVDVTLYDGTVYENATIVGADSSTDLAVIKVKATGLKPAEFGDSTALQLGDRVVALGNAGGLGWSATQGIVSGLARDVYEDTGYAIKCIQVDAAINPGNSGGPLFNAAGQVIAVNSAKIVASGYEGLGFSIPINEAKKVIDDLIQNGYVSGRVSLGITGRTYSDSYYEGFLINSVEKNSPLTGKGVQQGDLITAVDNTKVSNYAELRSALAQHEVGDTVTLTLLRSSNRQVNQFTVEVKLAEATAN